MIINNNMDDSNMDDSGQLQTQLLEYFRSIESKKPCVPWFNQNLGEWSFVHSYFVGVGYSTSGA
jgi:hypothetical protein